MKLPPRDAARLRRLLPRLASGFDGEVVAAARAIGRLLANSNADFHDLAQACAGSPPPSDAIRPASSSNFGDLARAVRDADAGRLQPHERTFVLDMCSKGFRFRPSPRQSAFMAGLLARLQARTA